jgi:hypothetical protein
MTQLVLDVPVIATIDDEDLVIGPRTRMAQRQGRRRRRRSVLRSQVMLVGIGNRSRQEWLITDRAAHLAKHALKEEEEVLVVH